MPIIGTRLFFFWTIDGVRTSFSETFLDRCSGGRYQLGQPFFFWLIQPPRHIHVRGAFFVRGIGESLAYRFLYNDHLRGKRLVVARGHQVFIPLCISLVWDPDFRGSEPRRWQLAPRCSPSCHGSTVPEFFLSGSMEDDSGHGAS